MISKLSRTKTKEGAAVDSVFLTITRVITAVLGLVVTKLLSTFFSLTDYGTYSQAMLIVTSIASVSILGLTNGLNYFYNSSTDIETKHKYLVTIFGLQFLIGSICGIAITVLAVPIINYFKNGNLIQIIFFAAWMPLFENLLNMLQVLFISIKKARMIALRNLIISLLRLAIMFVAVIITNNIVIIFISLVILEILQVVYFFITYRKLKGALSIKLFDLKLIKPILSFCIPMAIYVFTHALCRDIDKYVVSYFSNTETLAIYSNASKQLPFDLLSSSFVIVLVPIITRQIASKRDDLAKQSFSRYLNFGIMVSWIIISGLFLMPKEMMEFLYDDKYISGYQIFMVYLGIGMLQFANITLILSAKGKTKTIMYCSIIALIVNLIFDILSYYVIGIIGPAIVNLLVTLGLIIALLHFAAKELSCKIRDFFDFNEIATFIFVIFCALIIVSTLKELFINKINNTVVRIFVTYLFYIIIVLPLNIKKIIRHLKGLNKL